MISSQLLSCCGLARHINPSEIRRGDVEANEPVDLIKTKVDAGKAPLIDNSTKAEPFDESRHEKVAENNAKHATRLCRGNDGRV